jgi:hypothetical protein
MSLSLKDQRLMRMVELARGHVERDEGVSAEVLYRVVCRDGSPPVTPVERLAVGEACLWYARRALAEGRHGEAIDWYQRAVSADPRCAEYRVEYVRRALLPMGMTSTARIEAERATRIDPEHADAWSALGDAEQVSGNVEAAAVAYDRRLELRPDEPDARLDRASVAINVADYGMARRMAEPLLGADREGAALHVLGMIAYRESRHEEAIDLYDRAIAAGFHDESLARWNRSLALHAIGRHREGWADAEHRGRQRGDPAMALLMNRFVAPALTRETLRGPPLRVHVHQEMGHGDCLATVRHLDTLCDLGHDVRLEVNESMVDLLARSFPRVKVVPKALDYPSALGIPPFDVHCPMLSLPHLLDLDVDDVPWRGLYLQPDPEMVVRYDCLLGRRAGHERVGVCWSSGVRDGVWIKEYGRRKSMSFQQLTPLFRPGCSDEELLDIPQFVSLQVGSERTELNAAYVDDLLPAKPTWDDTAALVACLDLVITVDTSVAHLAGAMGVPTWVMCQRDCSSWHFMCWRPGAAWNERSPWYPSVRLFRQHRFNAPHYWDDVVADVAEALRDVSRGTSPRLVAAE